MKKLKLILAASAFCLAFLSGCKEEEIDIKRDKQESIILSESNVNEEKSDNESAVEKETSKAEKENSKDPDNSDSKDSDSSSEGDDDTESSIGGSYSNESGDITEIAVKLHERSCAMQWKYLVNCPYQLDYDDTSGEAVRVTDINSLSEITEEYCKIFAGNGSELLEKYFEEDGKVYCYDGGRGANIYYKGTELILVSSDENTASFTAVSHYADPETNEPMDSKSYDFKMINDNGAWKISVFTLPY